jgi:peptidylprolyl isomerase
MYNSKRPYQPIPARVDPDAGMIAGFKEGLRLLSVGDKATLYLPYELAYGANGGRGIPPQTNLIFEVEVVGLE